MISKEQCRAARGWLDWSQGDLAAQAAVNRKTVADFERGVSVPHDRTLRDLRMALEKGGVAFIHEGNKPVGIRVAEGDAA